MLSRIGRFTIRRRKLVLVGAVVVFVVSAAYGGPRVGAPQLGRVRRPGLGVVPGRRGRSSDTFGSSTPNLILLVTAQERRTSTTPPSSPPATPSPSELGRRARRRPTWRRTGRWATPRRCKSDGGDRALVLARIERRPERGERAGRATSSTKYTRDDGTITVGDGRLLRGLPRGRHHDRARPRAGRDRSRLPITLILLLLVFGSVVSASLPLAIGALSVVGTFVVLRLLSTASPRCRSSASTSPPPSGLGLAIDYSLFMVSRYREELQAGHDPQVAVQRTVRTAGPHRGVQRR